MVEEAVKAIQSRDDLAKFVRLLMNDLSNNSEEWENPDLQRFLESMSRWIKDMDGLFRNVYEREAPEQPTWALFGEILLGAKYYE
jgi:hypothetical protein